MAEARDRLDILGQAQDLRLFRARNNRDVARQRLFKVVVVCGIIGPLGALFVHLILAGRLVRRIRAVGDNARRLAHGVLEFARGAGRHVLHGHDHVHSTVWIEGPQRAIPAIGVPSAYFASTQ